MGGEQDLTSRAKHIAHQSQQHQATIERQGRLGLVEDVQAGLGGHTGEYIEEAFAVTAVQ